MNTQVHKLCIEFCGEKVKLQKMKEEVDRDLAVREDNIKDLQAQLDCVKHDYGNRSPADWSKDIQQKETEIKRLTDQCIEAGRQFEKLQQDLDETCRSAETSMEKKAQELRQRDAQIQALNETSTAAHDNIKSLEQELAEVKRSKETTIKAVQEDATRKSQDAQNRLKAMEIRLKEVDSAKLAVETRFSDLENRSSNEAGQRQKEMSGLRQQLESADHRLKDMDERHAQQQELVRQKDSDTEKLKQETEKLKQDIETMKQEHAKAIAAVVQIPNSQPQQDIRDQTSTSSTKKGRKAVNRSARSVSKSTSSNASASETQPTSDVLESTQPISTGTSIFGPFSEERSNSYGTCRLNSTQEDDEMLDLSNSQLSFLKQIARPDSSQSEAQRAFSLGSQEVLTAEGVRFRGQNNQRQASAETQVRPSEHGSSSSSLSEARNLDESYRNAAGFEWEQSQSQERAQNSQQQSQDVEPQSQQQSLGLSIFNELAVGPHAFETPMKAGGRNLQGTGRKLTPRPESQPRQSKTGAPQPITKSKQPKGSAATPRVQKKVSALDSGPRNFKIGGSGKGKSISFDVPDAEEDDDDDDGYSAPGSSVCGSHSPQKRLAPQSSKTNKRQRTETATPVAAPTSQCSAAATPRRSQTSSAMSGPQRRRSSRTSKT